MLWQVGEKLGFAKPTIAGARKAPSSAEEEGAEYGHCLLKLMDLCEKYFGEELALRKLRFYVRMTSVWLTFGHSLISVTTKAKSFSEMREGVQRFFSVPVEMVGRTQLRE
jgi:tRNA-dihydrouridine synthase B